MSNLKKQKHQNLFSVKPWASRLHGKVAAIQLREALVRRLDKKHTLHINMAGVKELSPGFAIECFGRLYLIAVKNECQIKFTHTPPNIRPIVLSAISAATRPEYERTKVPRPTN